MNLAFKITKDKPLTKENFETYKIVSLWDMLQCDMAVWLKAFRDLGQLNGQIAHHDMFREIFKSALTTPEMPMGSETSEIFGVFAKALTEMGLRVAAASAEKIVEFADWPGQKNERDLKPLTNELMNIIEYELKERLVLLFSHSEAQYILDSAGIFSLELRDAFPSAEYEMDEACRCFAFERYTAAVFHLMRVLEVGLNALCIALGCDLAASWNTALNDIEKEIRSRNTKTHGPEWKAKDEPFYAEAATHFRMVKNAWRNHTMHIKEHYDEERAKAILNSVSDLMRHLATRLHE